MKTKFVLTILTALLVLSLYAQTNVGGTYTSDATWMISGSPYNVISNVGIPDEITLTIESGVVVNFNSDHQIIIHGSLIANGDNDMNIVFNSNVSGSAMILFQYTNLNNSSLSYIEINGPKSGISLSTNTNDNNSGTLTINNLSITNSKIQTNGNDSFAEFVINNSSLTNTIVIGEYPYKSETIEINNSNITGGEIISDSFNKGIFLNNATISSTLIKVACGANVNISESIVSEASFSQNTGSSPGDDNCLNIDGSHLTNSQIDMPVSTVNINASNFHYNSDFSELSCIVSGNGIIDSSNFIGNGSLIAIERGYTIFYYNNNNPFTITYCTFTGFGTDIKINAGDQYGAGNGPVSVHYCDFLDNPVNYIISNHSPYDASATFNWWGTTEITEIENAIYDYWDDMSYGQVFYTDFLSGPINPPVSGQTIYNDSNYDISIFPNPFSTETKLKTSDNFENASLTIYNTSGQVVKKVNNISGPNIKLGRDNLPNGIFLILMVQDNKTIMADKLIITD